MTVEIPEGFTAWTGETNLCPCAGKAADVMFRRGDISRASVNMPRAEGWMWRHGNHDSDIVAYRVIENSDS